MKINKFWIGVSVLAMWLAVPLFAGFDITTQSVSSQNTPVLYIQGTVDTIAGAPQSNVPALFEFRNDNNDVIWTEELVLGFTSNGRFSTKLGVTSALSESIIQQADRMLMTLTGVSNSDIGTIVAEGDIITVPRAYVANFVESVSWNSVIDPPAISDLSGSVNVTQLPIIPFSQLSITSANLATIDYTPTASISTDNIIAVVSQGGFLTTINNIVNSQIAANADIDMSKISGLISTLNSKLTQADIQSGLALNNLDVAGAVTANAFFGDGSNLTGIRATSVGDNSISSDNLQSNAVTTAKIQDGAVTAGKLGTDSVDQDAIASNAVGSDELIDASVSNADIAANAVSSNQLMDNAVTSAKIQDGSIQQADLGDKIISNDQVATGNFPSITGIGSLTGTLQGQNAVFSGIVEGASFSGNGASLTNINTNQIPNLQASINALVSSAQPDLGDFDNTASFNGQVNAQNLLVQQTLTANQLVGGGAGITGISTANISNFDAAVDRRLSSSLDLADFSGPVSFNSEIKSQAAVYTGDVTANAFQGQFIGNGSQVTNISVANIPAFSASVNSLVTANVTPILADFAGPVSVNNQVDVQALNAEGSITANAFVGNGAAITNLRVDQIPSFNQEVSALVTANVTPLLADFDNQVSVNNTVKATAFQGNGANLTSLSTSNITNFDAAVDSRLSTSLTLDDFSGNVSFNNQLKARSLVIRETATADSFAGNGLLLTNLSVANIPTFNASVSSLVTANTNTLLADYNQAVSINNQLKVGSIIATSSITADAFTGNGAGLIALATSNITGFDSAVDQRLSASLSLTDFSGAVSFNSQVSANSLVVRNTITANAVVATSLAGNGLLITNINVANIPAFNASVNALVTANLAPLLADFNNPVSVNNTVSANFFAGNGSRLTALATSNITNFDSAVDRRLSASLDLDNFSGVVSFNNQVKAASLLARGTVTANSVIATTLAGNGFLITNISVANLPTFNQSVNALVTSNLTPLLADFDNPVSVNNTVSANFFAGNGSRLSALATSNITGFDSAVDQRLSASLSLTDFSGAVSFNSQVSANSLVVKNTITANSVVATTLAGNGFLVTNISVANLPTFNQSVNALVTSNLTPLLANFNNPVSVNNTVSANFFAGNGSRLTALATSNITNFDTAVDQRLSASLDLDDFSGAVSFNNQVKAASLLARGTVTANSVIATSLAGNGLLITNISVANLPTFNQSVNALVTSNLTPLLADFDNPVSVNNTVSANFFAGNGSRLSALATSNITGFDSAVDQRLSASLSLTDFSGAVSFNSQVSANSLVVRNTITANAVVATSLAGNGLLITNINVANIPTFNQSVNALVTSNLTPLLADFDNPVSVNNTVSANFFAGNGSRLTSLATSNITNFDTAVDQRLSASLDLDDFSGAVSFNNQVKAASLLARGTVTANSVIATTLAGNGFLITNISVANLPTFNQSVNALVTSNLTPLLADFDNPVSVNNTVSANFFAGNGSRLTALATSNITGFDTAVDQRLSVSLGLDDFTGAVSFNNQVSANSLIVKNTVTANSVVASTLAGNGLLITNISVANIPTFNQSVNALVTSNITPLLANFNNPVSINNQVSANSLVVKNTVRANSVVATTLAGNGLLVTNISVANIPTFNQSVNALVTSNLTPLLADFDNPVSVNNTVSANFFAGNGSRLSALATSNITGFDTAVDQRLSASLGLDDFTGAVSFNNQVSANSLIVKNTITANAVVASTLAGNGLLITNISVANIPTFNQSVNALVTSNLTPLLANFNNPVSINNQVSANSLVVRNTVTANSLVATTLAGNGLLVTNISVANIPTFNQSVNALVTSNLTPLLANFNNPVSVNNTVSANFFAGNGSRLTALATSNITNFDTAVDQRLAASLGLDDFTGAVSFNNQVSANSLVVKNTVTANAVVASTLAGNGLLITNISVANIPTFNQSVNALVTSNLTPLLADFDNPVSINNQVSANSLVVKNTVTANSVVANSFAGNGLLLTNISVANIPTFNTSVSALVTSNVTSLLSSYDDTVSINLLKLANLKMTVSTTNLGTSGVATHTVQFIGLNRESLNNSGAVQYSVRTPMLTVGEPNITGFTYGRLVTPEGLNKFTGATFHVSGNMTVQEALHLRSATSQFDPGALFVGAQFTGLLESYISATTGNVRGLIFNSTHTNHIVGAGNAATTVAMTIQNEGDNGTGTHSYINFLDDDADVVGKIQRTSGGSASYGTIVNYSDASQYIANNSLRFESTGADYAEYLEKLNPAEKLFPAQIVGVVGDKITKDTSKANRVMVISQAPVILGNARDRLKGVSEPVAFVGQVLVQVRGKVAVGDYIIPSGLHDGIGIAVSPDKLSAAQLSQIVGQAWTASDLSGINLVKVAITPLDNPSGVIAAMEAKQAVLSEKNAALRSELDQVKADLAEIQDLLRKKLDKHRSKGK